MVDRRTTMVLVVTLAALPGCSSVPRSRLSDCQSLARSLQSEVAQLRDESLKLRAENQDLSDRSVADARTISGLERENRLLEDSVVAYQREREEMAAAYERLRRRLASAANEPVDDGRAR